MSKHKGEKCETVTDGRKPGRTSPYHNTTRLKTKNCETTILVPTGTVKRQNNKTGTYGHNENAK